VNFEFVCSMEKKFSRQSIVVDQSLESHEILVAPTSVGICGSDLYHFLSPQMGGLRLGHEWIGRVLETGSEVSNVKVGDMITTSATLGCGECEYCLEQKVNLCVRGDHLGSDKKGAICSVLKFKDFNAIKIQNDQSEEVLLEVMAVAEQAMQMLPFAPRKVLVLGAGTVGVLCAFLFKEKNIDCTIVEKSDFRIEKSKLLGLPVISLAQAIIGDFKNKFDLVIDATNDRSGKGGWNYLSYFGAKNFHAIIIGKYLNLVSLNSNELAKLNGSIGFMRGVPLSTLQLTVNKWSGRLRELGSSIITHRFGADELDKAFETALDTSKSIKVVIDLTL